MRVVITHNEVTLTSAPDERDVLVQMNAVAEALAKLGHEAIPLSCDLDLATFKSEIERMQADCIFNLVESLDGRGQLIGLIPSLLDTMGIPYTGSPSASIYLTSHKVMAKEKLRAAGLQTPAWVGPYPHEHCSKYAFDSPVFRPEGPWIVKSVWEHASVGLSGEGFVFENRPENLIECLRLRAPELGGACFAESYIDGREFNLSLLAGPDGPMVLPPAEIVFEGYQDNQPKIVCYKAKWDETSFEYSHTPRRFDFPKSDEPLVGELSQIAVRCWQIFGLRGYARVDFRVDGNGGPWILEVNANPCLSPDAGFAAAVDRSGMPFDQAVECILSDVFWCQKCPSCS
jgi:D-alanine-D-alanine ligase